MKIVVIGAGPAGIFAALHAKKEDNEVILIEKNEKLGKKLAITGKGRCNLTNYCDTSDIFNQIVTNPYFMYSSIYNFTNHDLMKFFQDNGLKLKVERGGRVFPESDSAFDVIDVLRNKLKREKIKLSLGEEVINVEYKNCFHIETNKRQLVCDKIVVATGGLSYPMTGSTGFGYDIARTFEHEIITPRPCLVPLEFTDNFIKGLVGLSLKNVNLKVKEGKKTLQSEFGEMIFTHFGISGPIVLTISSKLVNQKKYKFYLDLKPALDEKTLENRILRDFDENKNKSIKKVLQFLTVQRIIPVILDIAGISHDKPVNQITKNERQSLIETIKNLPLTYKSHRPVSEGIITGGGVSVDQLDPSTMMSKLIDGLYFVGEVIDVDALTGGYNLQIAFSTGFLAGKSIKEAK